MSGFDWREYLHTAEEFFERVQNLQRVEMRDEALCRIGISRAYYAAFHATAQLVDTDATPGGTHERVIRTLKSSADRTYRRIGNDLDTLRTMRVRADYISERYPPRGFSGNAVVELQKAITYANNILNHIN